jgi:hypothetical protein
VKPASHRNERRHSKPRREPAFAASTPKLTPLT